LDAGNGPGSGDDGSAGGSDVGDPVDLDNDGNPDGVIIDVDGDGKPDGVDTDYDGDIDTWLDGGVYIPPDAGTLPFPTNEVGQVLCGDAPCACSDGIDNDDDGLTDLADPEC